MRKVMMIGICALAGCAAPQVSIAPSADPSHPGAGATDFTLAPDERVLAGRRTAPVAVPAGALGLAELIDIAQRNTPSTRAAWLRARQAAEAVGLVDTAYLPRVNAHILAGAARSRSEGYSDPGGLLPDGSVSLGADRAMMAVSLQWLLFDFGKRDAARGEAQELAFAADVGFTGAHQKLIFDVTLAYHDLHAATRRQGVHEQRLRNARALAASARAKRGQGLSTVTDVAQAEQAVAQARFDLARAQSETRVAQTALMARLGLPANQELRIAFPGHITLPRDVPAPVNASIERALTRRPDLQAAFARARASAQHIAAVEAEFRPRIIAAASLGHSLGHASLDDSRRDGALGFGDGHPVASAFVGLTIPLWDAGARERRLRIARDQHSIALADAESLRILAESEIISAYEMLRASLAANRAATELISTAQVSYDAATGFEREGLASVAEVSLARQLLFDAQLAQIEAQHAAFSAAATLAFASGQMG